MNIAIASGKGGTGKTTISTSLALSLIHQNKSINFIDCDVEAPNAHIFLQPTLSLQEDVNLFIPNVIDDKCTGCGLCSNICEFNAIIMLGKLPLIFPELCHSCGGCTLACPEKALIEEPISIGKIESGKILQNSCFSHGILDIGQPMAVPVIAQLKETAAQNNQINIFDSPPGTSCPVVETLRNNDYIILVTEPNPFGLHDLKLAHQLTSQLKIPTGIIINKDEAGFNELENFCSQNKIPILMRIPFKKEYSQAIAKGLPLVEFDPSLSKKFVNMYNTIKERITQ